jgi:hypothetical protein
MEVPSRPDVGSREAVVYWRPRYCLGVSIALSVVWREVVLPCALYSHQRRFLPDAQVLSVLSVYELRVPPEFSWRHGSRAVSSAQSIRPEREGETS